MGQDQEQEPEATERAPRPGAGAGHAYEGRLEAEVDASPEAVWDAVATGPGIDSWYMGRNEVEPGVSGSVRTAYGDAVLEATVTAWDPPRKFAYRGLEGADGRFFAFEFTIEGRDGGRTVLRLVASGFIPGEDWEAEYEAMRSGGGLFFRTLVAYLTHFAGRTATPVNAFSPPVTDWPRAWAALYSALGLPPVVAPGHPVRCAPDGLPPIDGVVDDVTPECLGLRTPDALYRFLQGFFGVLVVDHHLFAPGVDGAAAERAWTAWLAGLLPAPPPESPSR